FPALLVLLAQGVPGQAVLVFLLPDGGLDATAQHGEHLVFARLLQVVTVLKAGLLAEVVQLERFFRRLGIAVRFGLLARGRGAAEANQDDHGDGGGPDRGPYPDGAEHGSRPMGVGLRAAIGPREPTGPGPLSSNSGGWRSGRRGPPGAKVETPCRVR